MSSQKEIDKIRCKVSGTKRFVAYLIDWFIGSLFISLPIALYYLSQTQDIDNVSNVNIYLINQEFGKNITIVVGIIAILLGLIYYVLIPYKNNGQTLGKKALHFKVVNYDGSDANLKTIIIRQFLSFILLETYLFSLSHLLIYIFQLITGIPMILIVGYNYVGLLISVTSCFLVTFSKTNRAIHDIIAKTKVIEVKSNIKDQRI